MENVIASWVIWGGLIVLAVLLVAGRHWLFDGQVTGCLCGCGLRPREKRPDDSDAAPPKDAAS